MKRVEKNSRANSIIIVLIGALIYAFAIPVLKVCGVYVPPIMQGALMYIGAAIGVLILCIISSFKKNNTEKPLEKKDFKYVFFICLTDIVAVISVMYGINLLSGETSSLFLTFQTLVTAIIGVFIFKERLGILGWIGLGLIMISGCLLPINEHGFEFNYGIIFILIACLAWGIQNNLCRVISDKDPKQITLFKSFSSGFACLAISSLVGEKFSLTNINYALIIVILGFFAYGIAIICLIFSERELGASIASTFFGINPFLGAILSLIMVPIMVHIINPEKPITIVGPYFTFYIALAVMVVGVVFCAINEIRKNNKLKAIK